LSGGQARLEHDVVLEVEDALEILQRHVEQQADARRQRLQEPDVRDRRGQLDVAHALAAHLATA
jgi:predicted dienelactone hydrolase